MGRPAAIALGGVPGHRARGAGAGVSQQGLLAGAGPGRAAVLGVLEHHLRGDAAVAARTNCSDVFLEQFGFSANTDAAQDNGYIAFMQGQNVIVMILLAFSGSLLVGSDFRLKTLPFYLSRRIDKRHYIVGKLLAVSSRGRRS